MYHSHSFASGMFAQGDGKSQEVRAGAKDGWREATAKALYRLLT